MKKNRDKLFGHGKEFQQIFSIGLNKFLDPITGFDVIKFDEWLKVPDGTSTKDYLTKKYGVRSAALVMELF
jgi:hypothetical protein